MNFIEKLNTRSVNQDVFNFVVAIVCMGFVGASAWLTSFLYCLITLTVPSIVLLILDIVVFPVGIVHGFVLWVEWIFHFLFG